jgi:hypothetical protein
LLSCVEVQRFRVQRFRGSKVQGSKVQRFKGSEVQRFSPAAGLKIGQSYQKGNFCSMFIFSLLRPRLPGKSRLKTAPTIKID